MARMVVRVRGPVKRELRRLRRKTSDRACNWMTGRVCTSTTPGTTTR